MPFTTAGKSLIAFAVVTLLSSVVSAFVLDTFRLDVTAIFVFFLGFGVLDGNTSSVKWSIAAMAFYLVAAVVMFVIATYRVDLILSGGRSAQIRFWVLPCLGIVAIWAATNIALLRRYIPTCRMA